MHELNESWKNVLKYVDSSDGKNLSLKQLKESSDFCGVILHDEGEAFRRAQDRLKALGYGVTDGSEAPAL